jgi:hypothetical protein
MRRFIGAAVLFAGLSIGAVAGQDGPITIKLKKPGPGDVTTEKKTETSKTKISFGGMGKDEEAEGRFEFTDEVVQRPEKSPKPTELKRTYKTAEMSKDGMKEDLGLVGKTVLIKKDGDKYAFTVDGKPVGGKAAEILAKEFSGKKSTDETDFLPGKPVKVGETWKVDVAKAAADLAEGGMVIDEKASKADGKLVKVYDKDGAKFGVIEVKMDLSVTKIKPPVGDEIPLKDGSKVAIDLTIDACIDGTKTTGGGKMAMKGALAGEVMGSALKFDLDVKVDGTTTEVKK